jgi:CRISPR-associated endonuclease/helicase Cas3
VQFDFSLLSQQITVEELANIIFEKCESYSKQNHGKVKCIVEFIFKRRAGEFYELVKTQMENFGYEVLLLSGTILEPRRKEIINKIKKLDEDDAKQQKILLVTTQVVEAGVDIDMDIGFKDRSLIDSDEQLAGRVNRNARSKPASVYLFKLDRAFTIYGKDLRYKITREEISDEEYREILKTKNFDMLYKRVCEQINKENLIEYIEGLNSYLKYFKYLKLYSIHHQFRLIDDETCSVYVPLIIPRNSFSKEDLRFLKSVNVSVDNNFISGAEVWEIYCQIATSPSSDFIQKRIDLKRIYVWFFQEPQRSL